MCRRVTPLSLVPSLRCGGSGRALLVLLVLVVALDVSNPFVRGAFEFNPSDSVDGLCRLRLHADASPVALAAPLVGRRDDLGGAAARRVAALPARPRRPDPGRPVARSRSAVRDAAPPGGDDH